MNFEQQLNEVAQEIYRCLCEHEFPGKIVLAESCTGGRAAAALVGVAGISDFFCGSAVVYRPDSKMRWLGVSESLIEQHSAESAEVTEALAIGVLERTPEATVSAAITGHLTPQNSNGVGDHIFVAIATKTMGAAKLSLSRSFPLSTLSRADRQTEAALKLCETLLKSIVNNAARD